MIRTLLVPLLCTLVLTAPLVRAAQVHSVNLPAWLERGATRQPLAPGMELRAGDTMVSGDGSRILFDLGDGGQVKLGEQARFRFDSLEEPRNTDGLVKGFFRVLTGAFRYATGKLGLDRRRELNFRVGTITAGIRGTDIWGRSRSGEDLVLLIEGQVEIAIDNMPPSVLARPLTYRVAHAGQAAGPAQSADPATVQAWAQETEPQTGDGLLTLEGPYSVHLAANRERGVAEAFSNRFRTAGYPVVVRRTEVNGETWYRSVIDQFASREDAEAARRALGDRFGVDGIWLSGSAR